jgi:rare lipoprotein A
MGPNSGQGAGLSTDLIARLSGVGAGVSLIARIGAVAGCCLALAHCGKMAGGLDPKYGVSASPRVVAFGQPVPKGGGAYRVGKSYTIAGRTYSPEESAHYSAEGIASWYGEDFHGRLTANGEVYDMGAISAAHPTLPIPSYVRVTNLANKRSIIVRVNDRGPYHQNRLIDVSVRTAKLLGFYDRGTTRVRVDYVGPASLEGSDDSKLEATLRRGTPAPGPAEVRVASSRSMTSSFFARKQGVREAVPTPTERPFELGHEAVSARVAKRTPSGEFSAVMRAPNGPARAGAASAPRRMASGAAASSFEARFALAAGIPAAGGPIEPVAAYASTAAAPSSGSVISGRGLY